MGKTSDLFKKTGDTKGTFHASLGVIKDGNINDQTEAEEIKKRWKEYTRELYKKGFSDLDNHNGVVAFLEPDILEYEGKWALGNITTNKASVGDGIPDELFKILKNDANKELQSICQQIWETQQWPQDWKRSISIPVPRRMIPKNVLTTIQLHSFHVLGRLCLKFLKIGFGSTWTKTIQMYKLGFNEAEEPAIKLPTFVL